MLSVEDYAVYYTSIKSAWPRTQDLVAIKIQDYQRPLRIPLEFIAKSGHNSWHLVHTLVGYLVNERGRLQREDGSLITLDDQPVAGTVCFVPNEAATFTWRKGPQTGARGKVATEDDHSSIVSASGESSAQSSLREAVVARDGRCIVTGVMSSLCDAAHLVPKTRPDIYDLVLGDDFEGYRYAPSMGVLLGKTEHVAYDKYQWSFYLKDNVYYVHVFTAQDLISQYHGLAIPRSTFRTFGRDEDLPDPRLCAWHYAQCAQMHVRGFSAGMSVQAI